MAVNHFKFWESKPLTKVIMSLNFRVDADLDDLSCSSDSESDCASILQTKSKQIASGPSSLPSSSGINACQPGSDDTESDSRSSTNLDISKSVCT